LEGDHPNWLLKTGQIVIAGYIYQEWLVVRPLLGIQEQDEAGSYFISNEGLGLYAVGFSQKQALADFKSTLVSNYQLLEARAADEPELKALFREYQHYLKPKASEAQRGGWSDQSREERR